MTASSPRVLDALAGLAGVVRAVVLRVGPEGSLVGVLVLRQGAQLRPADVTAALAHLEPAEQPVLVRSTSEGSAAASVERVLHRDHATGIYADSPG